MAYLCHIVRHQLLLFILLVSDGDGRPARRVPRWTSEWGTAWGKIGWSQPSFRFVVASHDFYGVSNRFESVYGESDQMLGEV